MTDGPVRYAKGGVIVGKTNWSSHHESGCDYIIPHRHRRRTRMSTITDPTAVAVNDWLRVNNIDPAVVLDPEGQRVTVANDTITYTAIVSATDSRGNKRDVRSGADIDAVVVGNALTGEIGTRHAPLIVKPNPVVAEWLRTGEV